MGLTIFRNWYPFGKTKVHTTDFKKSVFKICTTVAQNWEFFFQWANCFSIKYTLRDSATWSLDRPTCVTPEKKFCMARNSSQLHCLYMDVYPTDDRTTAIWQTRTFGRKTIGWQGCLAEKDVWPTRTFFPSSKSSEIECKYIQTGFPFVGPFDGLFSNRELLGTLCEYNKPILILSHSIQPYESSCLDSGS